MSEVLDDTAFLAGMHKAFQMFEKELIPAHKIKVAEDVRDRAKQIAEAHRLTGETIDSIEVTQKGDDVYVGSDLEKAPDEEYGTFDQAPRPFMRPAINEAAR